MLRLPGPSGAGDARADVASQRAAGRAQPHDLVLAALARVLTGGDADPTEPVPERDVSDLEREAVIALLHTGRRCCAPSRCSPPASRCGTDARQRPAADSLR